MTSDTTSNGMWATAAQPIQAKWVNLRSPTELEQWVFDLQEIQIFIAVWLRRSTNHAYVLGEACRKQTITLWSLKI